MSLSGTSLPPGRIGFRKIRLPPAVRDLLEMDVPPAGNRVADQIPGADVVAGRHGRHDVGISEVPDAHDARADALLEGRRLHGVLRLFDRTALDREHRLRTLAVVDQDVDRLVVADLVDRASPKARPLWD